MALLAVMTNRVKFGSEADLERLSIEYARAAREDPGCVEFRFARDVEDTEVMVFIEKWATREDFNDHSKHDHTREFIAAAAEFTTGAPHMVFANVG